MNRSVLVGASLATVLLSVFGTHSSQAAIINVPADHATIQAAINAAASGDTIIVAAGTYSENLTLNKSLTLQGAQAGFNACGRVGSETIVNGGGTIRLELLTGSSGSIIDGFTLTGGTNTIESNTGGIAGLQILNNKINGFTSAGIFLDDSGINITVGGNEVDAFSKTGAGASVHLDTDDFDGFWLTDNCIVYTGLNAFATGTGFFVDGNHNVGVSVTRNPMITGNLITRHVTGANLGSRSFAANTLGALPSPGASDQGLISDNTFSFNQFDGLQGGIQRTLIDNNKFDSNGRSGLALTSFGNTGTDRGAQGTTITNNCFTNNGQGSSSLGIPLRNAGLLYSSSQLAGTMSTNVANNNSFSGNYRGAIYGNTCSSNGGACIVAADCAQICSGGTTAGILCTSAADCGGGGTCPVPTCTTAAGGAQTLNAENNFWGDASGPDSPPQNPAGTGDRVDTPNSLGGLIDLIPFSTSNTPSCSSSSCTPPDCDDGNVCTDDICDPIDGCMHPFNTAPCEADKNPCSIDQCDGFGSCERVGFVECADPTGECDGGSFCDTDTGDCVEEEDPPLSTPCDTDGTLCTREHCDGSGSCVPMTPGTVECDPAIPPCEGGELCDPATGDCIAQEDPPLSTPCNTDGTLCTREHCNGSGMCVPMTPGTVECQPASPPCEGGTTCNPATGDCDPNMDPPLSTPCNTDSNLCTREHCDGSGSCVPMTPGTVECQPASPPCEGGTTCNPATGLCDPNPDAPTSTPCTTDSDLCTNEHCDGGLCVVFGNKCGACCDHEAVGGVCTDGVLPADCIGTGLEFFLNETCAVVEARGDCDEDAGACCDEDTFGGCSEVPSSQCVCPQCVFYPGASCGDIECTHNPIPTVSQWGLVVLTLLLLTGAKITFGRRRARLA